MGFPSKRKLVLLGSTGSVGENTLRLVRAHREAFEVSALACGRSLEKFVQQIVEFSPGCVSVCDEEHAQKLQRLLPSSFKNLPIFFGPEGHARLVEETKPHVLLSAMLGTFGLQATILAVSNKTPVVGIANKEILVMAGAFILEALDRSKTSLIPVDSEHSAIFQSLMGNKVSDVKKVLLTASGGPFRTRELSTFSLIKKSEALKHPNWSMGAKITIDSATMMNKGLEYIEALRLFEIEPSQLEVIVHPESIVHSMVEYRDGSVMAQLGVSDMKVPISLALHYPRRLDVETDAPFDLVKLGSLHFEAPDFEKFPCLRLAMEAYASGVNGPIVLNAANEVAVEWFLKDKIRFIDIAAIVEETLIRFASQSLATSLEEAIDLDFEVKKSLGISAGISPGVFPGVKQIRRQVGARLTPHLLDPLEVELISKGD